MNRYRVFGEDTGWYIKDFTDAHGLTNEELVLHAGYLTPEDPAELGRVAYLLCEEEAQAVAALFEALGLPAGPDPLDSLFAEHEGGR